MFGEESLSDVIKQRISTPIMANFFLSWIVINKEVLLALIFVNESDKLNGCYCYKAKCTYTKFELLPEVFNENLFYKNLPSFNYLWVPLFYALIITVSLPYIKAFFGFLAAGATLYGDRLQTKWGKSVISMQTHLILIEKLRKVERENATLNTSKDDFERSIQTLENDIKNSQKLALEKDKEISSLKKINEKVLYPIISSIINGIWNLSYEFEVPTNKLQNGEENFVIESGCEYLVVNDSNKVKSLRCYIDRYNCQKEPPDELLKKLRSHFHKKHTLRTYKYYLSFNKTFEPRNDEEYEMAYCQYIVINDELILGIEDYSIILNEGHQVIERADAFVSIRKINKNSIF